MSRSFTDNNNWDAFQLSEKANLRDVEINEVNNMMTCKDADRGFFTYYCENCGTEKTVHFGCNSRICTNCGKNHTDKWATSLKKALFNVPHRHAVLTIPDVLWLVVRENRFLLKVLIYDNKTNFSRCLFLLNKVYILFHDVKNIILSI